MSRAGWSSTCLLLVAFLGVASRGVADRNTAHSHHARGMELYKAGDYQRALQEFQAAYEADPNPSLLYNVAETQRQLHQDREALVSYERYLASGPHPRRKEEAQERIEELKRRLTPPPEPAPLAEGNRNEIPRPLVTDDDGITAPVELLPPDEMDPYGSGGSARFISLPAGVTRIDLAPPDFGYMYSGFLNGRRGLVLDHVYFDEVTTDDFGTIALPESVAETLAVFAPGVAHGITSALEVGAVLPIGLSPETDVLDPQLYARYALLPMVALQATLAVPTYSEGAVAGIGVPLLVTLPGHHQIAGGLEVEVFLDGGPLTLLDIPVAVDFAVSDMVFIGMHTGVEIFELEDVDVRLGLQARLRLSGMAELVTGFRFRSFATTSGLGPIDLHNWSLALGATLYL